MAPYRRSLTQTPSEYSWQGRSSKFGTSRCRPNADIRPHSSNIVKHGATHLSDSTASPCFTVNWGVRLFQQSVTGARAPSVVRVNASSHECSRFRFAYALTADRVPAVRSPSRKHDLAAEATSLNVVHAPSPHPSPRREFTTPAELCNRAIKPTSTPTSPPPASVKTAADRSFGPAIPGGAMRSRTGRCRARVRPK